MKHGGPDRNQGRKPAVSDYLRRIAIGAMCENLRRDRAEQAVLNRAGDEPFRHDIRELQKGFWTEREARHAKIQALASLGAGKIELQRAAQEFARWEAAQLKRFNR